jgi:hypothetical protein
MNFNNFCPIIEEYFSSLSKEDFNSLCLRLISKLEPDNGFASLTDASVIEMGFSGNSIHYLSIPNSGKPINNNIRSLLPADSSKFSIVTIFTNHSYFNDELNVTNFVNKYSLEGFNLLNPNKLCKQISNFEAEDIRFILGENSTLSHYIFNAQKSDKNRNIIKTILDYLFDTPLSNGIILPKESDKKFVHIAEKIRINLGKNQRDDANNLYNEHLPNILLIQEFFKNQSSLDNRPITALIDRIQKLYCEVKEVEYPDVVINDLHIFDKLAFRIIPVEHKDSPDYHYSAKSIILFIFEFCFIGAKTPLDQQFNLFDRLVE